MRNCLLFLIFICLVAVGKAQTRVLITGSFENLPVVQFFQQIEEKTPYFFYYDKEEVDSLTVNLTAKDRPLADLLQQAFQNNGLQFAIDGQNRVFVSKKYAIVTSLPPNFFRPGGTQPSRNFTDAIVAASGGKKGDRPVASDNKLYEVGIKTNIIRQGTAVVSGYVRNVKTGEPVMNASIFSDSLNQNAVTNPDGFYTLTLPAGKHHLNVQSLGMQDAVFNVVVYGDGSLNFEMKERVSVLKEVVVSAQKLANVNRVQMGVERLNIEAIKKVPAVFGETDILRAVTTLPGVKTVGEASTGLNVRGGSADQN
ncbi:MAG TPA: carboxypeptidase-like regulatory domain-containing protein, partial [Flavisolibacter sp.]|nr:carboxypeptidase-like regulatory domain-containing protein [Flavisolibacter sp.]